MENDIMQWTNVIFGCECGLHHSVALARVPKHMENSNVQQLPCGVVDRIPWMRWLYEASIVWVVLNEYATRSFSPSPSKIKVFIC